MKCFLRNGFRDFIFNVYFYVKYLKDSNKCNTYKCDKLYLVLLLRNAYRNGAVVTENILWDRIFKYYILQENNIKYLLFRKQTTSHFLPEQFSMLKTKAFLFAPKHGDESKDK